MKIIIVGAGPSGLLLGLFLAKEGIEVQLLEKSNEIDTQPRATHYATSGAVALDRAGVLSDIRKEGFLPAGVCWRKKSGEFIAGLSVPLPEESINRMVCLPLGDVSRILHQHLQRECGTTVHFQHLVTKIGQDVMSAWVEAETPTGTVKLTADYVIGCDGASSHVRRALFGEWEFPGRTWEQQIIATNVYYPFEKFGYWDSNFIVDPNDWYMAAKITRDGLWRVTYGDIPGLTREEYIERQPKRFEEILPGQPTPSEYRLTNIAPYKIHQRLASRLRVGRFLLAADAAHLCNPFGGMGLTGGIADVEGLSECLIGIHKGCADESILDKYDEVRREKYNNMVNPISESNFRRLWGQDPELAGEKDPFLALAKQAAGDEELLTKLSLGTLDLRHDFTQYYASNAGVASA